VLDTFACLGSEPTHGLGFFYATQLIDCKLITARFVDACLLTVLWGKFHSSTLILGRWAFLDFDSALADHFQVRFIFGSIFPLEK
jgi:hypothetical protein